MRRWVSHPNKLAERRQKMIPKNPTTIMTFVGLVIAATGLLMTCYGEDEPCCAEMDSAGHVHGSPVEVPTTGAQ